MSVETARPQLVGQAWPQKRILAAQCRYAGEGMWERPAPPAPGGRGGAIMRTATRRPAQIDAHPCGGREKTLSARRRRGRVKDGPGRR